MQAAGGLASTYIGGTDMTEATRSDARPSTSPPAWFNLHAVVDEKLCDEMEELAGEAEALLDDVERLSIRAFRAHAAFELSVTKATEGYREVSDGLYYLARRLSGFNRLENALTALVADLEIARGEGPPGEVDEPEWLEAERQRAGVEWPRSLKKMQEKLTSAVAAQEELAAAGA
jgi:hypothetical protein